MGYVSKTFRVCDRCKVEEEEEDNGQLDSETGWAELKFTYVSKRWHICRKCIDAYLTFMDNEAVLPVKIIRRGA